MKNILLLPGDGIGPEIMAEAEKVLRLLQERAGLAVTLDTALLGGCAVDASGEPYPPETRAKARAADAVLLACVGGPKWDNLPRSQRPETGLLAIRADLGLFANLRPARVLDALAERSALKAELVRGLDILIVRELTGGIYFGQPRGLGTNGAGEREGYNTLRYSESEVRRIARVAFTAAQGRQKRLCSIDKMNVLESSQLWRDVVTETAADFPDVTLTHLLVDNAAMQLVRNPRQFDVIVTGNLFGDILSDEASQLTGSIGLLPSASLRADGVGLFEPVHGSAPDIAGKGIANPYAMLLSLAMLLRHSLHEENLARLLEAAVENSIAAGVRSADLVAAGQQAAGTAAIGDAVCRHLAAELP